ncbi:MAG: choice-of-anchor E domain-containing protein [Actinomycetota bacterium]
MHTTTTIGRSKQALLRGFLAGLIVMLLVAAAGLGLAPGVSAQDSGGDDATGIRLTDFTETLSIPGFDGSLGVLAAAELTISGEYEGRVLRIVNQSGGQADFLVSTNVQLCVGLSGGGAPTYADCQAGAASTTVMFETDVVQESFAAMAPGGTGQSATPGSAQESQTLTILDPAALTTFIDTPAIDFGVATLAGFEALGGGGNSTVQVETFADVALSIRYQYISLDVAKATNGLSTATVTPGDPVEWTYDVTNTGNTELVDVAVTDDQEGDVCTIASIAVGATERCTLTGIAGDAPYTNVATAIGAAAVNPGVTDSADASSSYLQPDPTPTPEPTAEPTPEPTVEATPAPAPAATLPAVSIELATNGIDADEAPGVELDPGAPIVWRYFVTNTGPDDLFGLVVTDDSIGGICTADSLRSGESFECSREGTAVDSGSDALVATVVGQNASAVDVTDRDPTHHSVGDEILGIVITPTAVPVSDVPDEVLALTGDGANGPAAIALIASGIGLVAISASEALRRRHRSLEDELL